MNVEEYFEVFTGGNSNTLTWTPRAIKDFAADYHEMREREKNKVNNVVLDSVICKTPWKSGITCGVSYKVLAVLEYEYVIQDDDECSMLIGKDCFK